MTQDLTWEEDVSLSVVDADQAQKLKEKERKVARLMEVIKEHGLENDKEFMNTIVDAIEGIEKN